MKTLKQLREEYDYAPVISDDEVMLEATQSKLGVKKISNVPSITTMPNLLMFRRVSYKRYPDDQIVALYYSKSVDKYLSIPFGPTGNLNLSESVIYDTLEELEEGAKLQAMKGAVKGAVQGAAKGLFKGNAIAAEPGMAIGAVVGGVHGAYKGAKNAYKKAKDEEVNEDWQSVNRKDKTDGLSQAAVNAYRRENPGSKLQTAVTEKNPKGKRAARRKSFCSRMSGMKKRLTSAKTARDPDSRINKALRRWNCEESFRQKLYEKRMQQEGVKDILDAGAEAIVPYYSAGKKLYKGDYKGAAADAAMDTALLATGAIAGKALGAGARGISKIASRFRKAPSKSVKAPRGSKTGALGSAADAVKNLSKGSSTTDTGDAIRRIPTDSSKKAQAKVYTPSLSRSSAIDDARSKTLMRKEYEKARTNVSENKISDIRAMIESDNTLHDLVINGRSITLNSSMAKRIVEVYDSVNSKNKKIVENMLNEDLESFKKLLNFSIKA